MGDQHGGLNAPERFADDPAFAVHEGGKLQVRPTRGIESIADLALTYTPGVARVSSAIAAEPPPAPAPPPPPGGAGLPSATAADPPLARRFTWAHRVVAVVSDGTAV